MTLKSSFATVLRAFRNKRNITQRQFPDATSRTYLSKLEGGKSSITLDKLEQLSVRLELSPLTLLALTLSEDGGKPARELVNTLQIEIEALEPEGGLPGLSNLPRPLLPSLPQALVGNRAPQRSSRQSALRLYQTELSFSE